jgi:hypothetical protein
MTSFTAPEGVCNVGRSVELLLLLSNAQVMRHALVISTHAESHVWVSDSVKKMWTLMMYSLFAAACCGCNPAAASTVFFSLWIAAAAIQTAATVSACSQPNTPVDDDPQK